MTTYPIIIQHVPKFTLIYSKKRVTYNILRNGIKYWVHIFLVLIIKKHGLDRKPMILQRYSQTLSIYAMGVSGWCIRPGLPSQINQDN